MCSTGDSKKKDHDHQGYIGEKGIGFKSVFKVAKRVHIQSEPYSFAFEYSLDSDDDGLGMLTPIQEEYEHLPPHVQTRFTLTPLAQSGFEKRVEDVESIPDTLLLFLNKLRRLHINIHRPSGDSSEVTYSYYRDTQLGLDKVVKRQRINYGGWTEQVNPFHVVKRTITNLPDDRARVNLHQADVVLAFPVDDDGFPVIKQQHVYAYLPLRQVGFPVRTKYNPVRVLPLNLDQFLIQSDFVTQASREDIFHSTRNQALLQGVAETFRDAILSFCEHESLQYHWMRYLPPDSVSDEFWKPLKTKILRLLCKETILRSRSGRLHYPAQLSFVPKDCRDEDGDPLFPDLENEKYLADDYKWEDFQALQSLDSIMLKWDDLIDRVEADLKRPDSKMKSSATAYEWHFRAAMVLSKPFGTKGPKSETARNRLRTLSLIPVGESGWVSGSNAVYFPTAGNASIPTDLGLEIVTPEAVLNLSRKRFFSHLGVKGCSVEQVVPCIRQKYEAWIGALTLEQSISHLRYLYWSLPPGQQTLGYGIRLIGPRGALLRPDEVYFPHLADGYSPAELFSKTGDFRQGFSANFLPSKYVIAIPDDALSHGISWTTWLEKVIGVQSCPRLVSHDDISEDFKYILRYRSGKLVGLLQRHWDTYEPHTRIPQVRHRLKNCRVPSKTGHYMALKDLYVPTTQLKALAKDISMDDSIFLRTPWEPNDEDEEEGWIFLKRFGARFTDDLNFYLSALGNLVSSAKDGRTSCALDSVFKVYKGIMRNCVTDEDISKVR